MKAHLFKNLKDIDGTHLKLRNQMIRRKKKASRKLHQLNNCNRSAQTNKNTSDKCSVYTHEYMYICMYRKRFVKVFSRVTKTRNGRALHRTENLNCFLNIYCGPV